MNNRHRKEKKQKTQYENRINRRYKDSLFRKVFSDKKDLLDLYNALNGTDYSNEEELTVTTLEDVVYISVKNDLSFLVGGTINLYEHQSSYNPNMPVRGLMYFARLYQEYIDGSEINVFSTVLKHLPVPVFIVFYNGTREEPDRMILRLTDAFVSENGKTAENACLECAATMLNINYGHNFELMQKCRRLEEYSLFVAEVRKWIEAGGDRKQAVDDAVDVCIEQGILRDILIRERTAIVNMVLSCTKKQYERLVEKELEQQEKQLREGKKKMEEQEKKMEEQEQQLRAGEKKMEEQEQQLRAGEKKMREQEQHIREQERLLELNRKLVSEKAYALLEQIQNDPELTQKLLSQYGI